MHGESVTLRLIFPFLSLYELEFGNSRGVILSHHLRLDSDNVNGVRTLPVGKAASPVTLESCTSACFSAGYRFSGAEYSGYEYFFIEKIYMLICL